MSCNHCNTKFNFFHKELGCSNCGLTFCNKCLKQKCLVPNKSTTEVPVCKTCFLSLTSKVSVQPTVRPPPDTYLRRLEALENPSAPPITMYKHDKKLNSLRTGLSPADQQLLDRLEKLKDEENKCAPPSEDEIRKRLNTLKGENEYVEGPSRAAYIPDNRTDEEKVDSILEQFLTERDIELAENPEEGIVARLATLREQGARPNEGPYLSNLHDSGSSEEEIDKITKKIMDEVALEEKTSTVLNQPESMEVTDEGARSSPELPWCVLCNKDAQVRCLNCNDLYCSECNTVVHKTWGENDHSIVNYTRK